MKYLIIAILGFGLLLTSGCSTIGTAWDSGVKLVTDVVDDVVVDVVDLVVVMELKENIVVEIVVAFELLELDDADPPMGFIETTSSEISFSDTSLSISLSLLLSLSILLVTSLGLYSLFPGSLQQLPK
jgi:hypothetical protein